MATSHPSDAMTGMKVGELARRTGLTVRTLHHYDAIGLLCPSGRTPSGHRLYERGDVERLQQIQSLRLMGLSLDAVQALLDGAAPTPRAVIDLQLARLQAQIAAQLRLAERLRALAAHLDAAAGSAEAISTDDLCRLIEVMTSMDKYFTPEQLQTLSTRREAVGPARMESAQREWAEIIPAVRRAIDDGVPPTDPAVLALARRWRGLVREFTGGDPAIGEAVVTMYREQQATLRERMPAKTVPDPDMFAYVGQAIAALPAE